MVGGSTARRAVLSARGRDATYSDTDSSDSGSGVFLTQPPGVSSRHRRPRTHGYKWRKKQEKLKNLTFPFLPRNRGIPSREAIRFHIAEMGSFFRCVRMQSQKRGSNQPESALPTIDACGEDLSELSEEEGHGSNEVDIKVVDRKCFLAPTKTKRQQTWCGQVLQQKNCMAGEAGEGTSGSSLSTTLHEPPADAPTTTDLTSESPPHEESSRELAEKTWNDSCEMHNGELSAEMEESNEDEELPSWQTEGEKEPSSDSDVTLIDDAISLDFSHQGRKSPGTIILCDTRDYNQTDVMEYLPVSQSDPRSLLHLRRDSAMDSDHESDQSREEPVDVDALSSDMEVEETPSLLDDCQIVSPTLPKSERLKLLSYILTVEEGHKSATEDFTPEVYEFNTNTEKSELSASCDVKNDSKKRKGGNDYANLTLNDEAETQISETESEEEGASERKGAALGLLPRVTVQLDKSEEALGDTAAAVETTESSHDQGEKHIHESSSNEDDEGRDKQAALDFSQCTTTFGESAEVSLKNAEIHQRGELNGLIYVEPESQPAAKSVTLEEKISPRKEKKKCKVHDRGKEDDQRQEGPEGLSAPPMIVETEVLFKKKRKQNGSVTEQDNGLMYKEPVSQPAGKSVTVVEEVSPKKKRLKVLDRGQVEPAALSAPSVMVDDEVSLKKKKKHKVHDRGKAEPEGPLPAPPVIVEEEVSLKKKKKKHKGHDGGVKEVYDQRQEEPEGLSSPPVGVEKEVSLTKKKKHEISRKVGEQEIGLIYNELESQPAAKSVTVEEEVTPKKKKKHKVHVKSKEHEQRQEEPECLPAPPVIVEKEKSLEKKKKKRKVYEEGGEDHHQRQEEPDSLPAPPVRVEKEVSRKKKKMKLEEHHQRQEEPKGPESMEEEGTQQKKKRRKREISELVDVVSIPDENDKIKLEEVAQKSDDYTADQAIKKKKKKKQKMRTSISESEGAQSVDSVSVRKKKKKGTSSFLDADAGESDALELGLNEELNKTCLSGLPEITGSGVKSKKKRKRKESETVNPLERFERSADLGLSPTDVGMKKKKKKKKKEEKFVDELKHVFPSLKWRH